MDEVDSFLLWLGSSGGIGGGFDERSEISVGCHGSSLGGGNGVDSGLVFSFTIGDELSHLTFVGLGSGGLSNQFGNLGLGGVEGSDSGIDGVLGVINLTGLFLSFSSSHVLSILDKAVVSLEISLSISLLLLEVSEGSCGIGLSGVVSSSGSGEESLLGFLDGNLTVVYDDSGLKGLSSLVGEISLSEVNLDLGFTLGLDLFGFGEVVGLLVLEVSPVLLGVKGVFEGSGSGVSGGNAKGNDSEEGSHNCFG
jgi:hypothetical protein